MVARSSEQNQNPMEEWSCGSVVKASCVFGRFFFSGAPVADVCGDVQLS